jgi:lipoate-protein ligase A
VVDVGVATDSVHPVSWRVERFQEAPSASHARSLPASAERSVWVFEPTVPALVLGSAQSPEVADAAAAGIEVVRRHSGGGAVLVVPGDVLWVDVVLPAGDPLWDDDVGRAFGWLGDVWAAALEDLGVATTVHRGALQRSRWSDLVCFAGLGPGELVNRAEEKLVGMAQRRTRAAARFQCAALGRWDPDALLALLVLPDDERAAAAADLRHAARGVGVDLDALVDAFLQHLP